MGKPDVVIVGGGPAGAATAIGLAEGGLRAVVLEREAETPDVVCGGFLSWATVARLRRMGIEPDGLGAVPIGTLAVFAGGRQAEAGLPAVGAALSRRALDTALLVRAAAVGAGVERGVRVRAVEEGIALLADGGAVTAPRMVLATGKQDVRGYRRTGGGTLGVRWRLGARPGLARMLAGRVELHLFDGGYAGLVLQEDGRANLCLAVRAERWAAEGSRPALLLSALAREMPALRARLEAAGEVGAPDAVANVPYGWRASGAAGEMFRVGDQAGVIPSLAGEGIAIALASGAAAARALLAGDGAGRFQGRLGMRLRRPLAVAGQVWRMAEQPAGAAVLVGCMRAAPAGARLLARLTRV